MKKTLIAILILPLIQACAVSKYAEPSISGQNFVDTNPPSLTLKFPFDLYLKEKKKGYTDHSHYRSYELTTFKNDIRVYITKSKLTEFNRYYVGTDDSKLKKPFYLDKRTNGYCAVKLIRKEKASFLYGNIKKYVANNAVNDIQIVRHLGKTNLPDEAWESTTSSKDMIEATKSICDQVLGGKKNLPLPRPPSVKR